MNWAKLLILSTVGPLGNTGIKHRVMFPCGFTLDAISAIGLGSFGQDWEHRTMASHAQKHSLSDSFLCWSRMQAEAGQGIEAIVARKELERRAGEGVFLWGVGNAPSVAINALARLREPVPVVFSIMKSRPKKIDSTPSRVVAWRRYVDAEGAERDLPSNSIVTSRGDSAKGAKRAHYALMCRSGEPLALARGEAFDVSAYRNAGGKGAPVGASQVTALLRQVTEPSGKTDYEANLKADLDGSYWVRLTDPINVPSHLLNRLSLAEQLDIEEWMELARDIRGTHQREFVGSLI